MTSRRPSLLGTVPRLTLALLGVPVLAGLVGTILPGLGWLPALGAEEFSFDAWYELFEVPGILRSIGISFFTGFAATLITFISVVLILATFQGSPVFVLIERLLSPLLSVPHAAAAFGLAFLIAPSGWIARAISPWATGWDSPPDLLIVNDPAGYALIAGLVVKEVPFLILMALAALPQADAFRSLSVGLTLGYGRVAAWVICVLPRIYSQVRLPVYAILAYSISNVEVATILGPGTPATLAVRLTNWMRDPDLELWYRAAAGATLQLGLVIAALLIWWGAECLIRRYGGAWVTTGYRMRRDLPVRLLGWFVAFLVTVPVLLGLSGLAVWSVSGFWRFPDVLPEAFTFGAWFRAWPALQPVIANSLIIGFVSVTVALMLVIACLEAGTRKGQRATPVSMWLLYLPLIIPQIAFLFGLQILATIAGLDGGLTGVIFVHLIFVVPYVYLSLSDAWHALDPRFSAAAASLGASPGKILFQLRLPLLLAPIMTAAAVGFAVSAGLYLPTLLIGAGRVPTLTTDAVALVSGGDRRLIGVYGLLQMLIPLVAFSLALAVPALVWRNRLALRGRA